MVDDELRGVAKVLQERTVSARETIESPRAEEVFGLQPTNGQAVEHLAGRIHHRCEVGDGESHVMHPFPLTPKILSASLFRRRGHLQRTVVKLTNGCAFSLCGFFLGDRIQAEMLLVVVLRSPLRAELGTAPPQVMPAIDWHVQAGARRYATRVATL